MPEPVIFVVDDDSATLRTIERDLERRFGRDYRIVTSPSPESGILTLERLAAGSVQVALICASLQMQAMSGVEFLERVSAWHREAKHILLITLTRRGAYPRTREFAQMQSAIALGRADLVVAKGWVSPEEWFYPQIQHALSDWAGTHLPHKEVVRIVGDPWSPDTHLLRDWLDRNGIPAGFHTTSSATGIELLNAVGAAEASAPIVIFQDGHVLAKPTPVDLAEALEAQTQPGERAYDLVILGGGPAGLAAAVYATSEGLSTVIVEPEVFGGHATDSSRIRNYLGFAEGISGHRLAAGAYRQALFFGAEFLQAQRATGLTRSNGLFEVTLSSAEPVRGKAVIVAIGLDNRRLPIDELNRLTGAGVYYGSSMVEMPGMVAQHAVVVGGGNSAGQAAIYLARFAEQVTMLIRGSSLDRDMSRYLVDEIRSTPNIEVLLRTQIVDARGERRLESLTVEQIDEGSLRELMASAVFLLIGNDSCSGWLQDTLDMDDRGFIRTGRDLTSDRWPLDRPPYPFETSMPGVFAVGDVRFRSLKRVAGAVGEGSVAVGSVRQWLAESRV